MSHCSAPVRGFNHSGELLPMQLVGAWISIRAPSAVSTSLSPSVCGTLTSVIEPLGACLKICSTAQGPSPCRYSPLGTAPASRSPRSLGGGGHPGRGPGGEQDGNEDGGQTCSAQVHAFMTPLGPLWLHGGRSSIVSV